MTGFYALIGALRLTDGISSIPKRDNATNLGSDNRPWIDNDGQTALN